MSEVSSRLLQQGRAPDPEFQPSERLFRRIPPSALEDDHPPEASITFPDFSVNREKYSHPEDVLIGYPEFGILTFQVRDVPARVSIDVRVFTFCVEHDPKEDNYAHSEVRTYCDGKRGVKPPRSVRTEFRLQLGKVAHLQPPVRVG
jgi:hypothetical protein